MLPLFQRHPANGPHQGSVLTYINSQSYLRPIGISSVYSYLEVGNKQHIRRNIMYNDGRLYSFLQVLAYKHLRLCKELPYLLHGKTKDVQ